MGSPLLRGIACIGLSLVVFLAIPLISLTLTDRSVVLAAVCTALLKLWTGGIVSRMQQTQVIYSCS